MFTVYRGKSHCSISAELLLIYWLCQRIPSDQVQFSSPALISCASRIFSLFLSASLPLSYPSSWFSFDCHPLVKPDHTIELNHIWQFKLVLFSLSLALRSISEQSGPSATAAPRLFCSYLSVCICVSLFPNPTLSITRRTKRMEPSNDRATLLWFSKDIITEFQHCTVWGN